MDRAKLEYLIAHTLIKPYRQVIFTEQRSQVKLILSANTYGALLEIVGPTPDFTKYHDDCVINPALAAKHAAVAQVLDTFFALPA